MIYLMMIDAEEDKQKFAILYETYRHLMMKVALNVLKDTFLAEDAVHEAFIISTTSLAGGLLCPCKGLLPAWASKAPRK